MDDARDIWNAVKAKFGANAESKKMRKSMLKQEILEFRIRKEEGLHKGYDRMQKILSQLNQLKAKPDAKDINLKFLRALPSSWSHVALTLKTKGGLEFLSFDDLYYKLKTLEVDVKGYSTFSLSQSPGPSHYVFVSATSTSKKMSSGDSPNYSSTTIYSVPSNSKTGSHRSDLEHIEKLDLEEMDLKWQMAMLSVRVHKFKQKAGRKIDFDKKESDRFNKQKVRCYKCQQRGHFAKECRAKGDITMKELLTKDQANYYYEITSITVNGKAAYELKGKFLNDLCDKAFSETNREDSIEHIEYFLKIVGLIDLPHVKYEELRLAVFPISLVGNIYKWFDEFKVMRTDAKNDPTNTVFEEWLASKFANHMMMDPFTREVLRDFWKKVDNEERVTNKGFSDLEETNILMSMK
nr:ribonuclease H-like domain-containing protein [Tanacetum cinerariifolium]